MAEPLSMSEVFSTSHQLKEIIGELEISYPDVMPDPFLTPSEIAYRAGQVSVVRRLKTLLDNG